MKKFLLIFVFFGVCDFAMAEIATTSYVDNKTKSAERLTEGTVNINRIPTGTTNQTVAIGNDKRFDSIPTLAPSDNAPPANRVYIWIE